MKRLHALLYILALSLCLPTTVLADPTFEDVPYEHYYHSGVSHLNSEGIVEGYEDGLFRPQQSINRAEFLKIVLEASEVEVSGSECFSDVSDEWFAEYICGAAELGYVEGYEDGRFLPAQSINFAEASKILVNVMGVEHEETDSTIWYEDYVRSLETEEAIAPTIVSFSQEVNRGEMAEMVAKLMGDWYGLGSSGSYDQILEDQENGFEYRLIYTYGASSSLAHLFTPDFQIEPLYYSNVSLVEEEALLAYTETIEWDDYWYLQFTIEDLETRTKITEIDLRLEGTTYESRDWYYEEASGPLWNSDHSKITLTVMNQAIDHVVEGYIIDVENNSYVRFSLDGAYYGCASVCWSSALRWSPNDQYLMYQEFSWADEAEAAFVILDLNSEEVGRVEVDGETFQDYYKHTWSEDGQSIVLENYDGDTMEYEIPFL